MAGAVGAGCSDDAPTTCPIGDRTRPIEIVAVHWPAGGTVGDLADGGVVDLVRPIQGGKVVYVGVRARNVDGCNVQLTAALRDQATQQVIALEQRPVRLVDGGDGWGLPEAAFDHLANLPACPNAAAARDVDGSTWRLELRLEEPGGRMAETSLVVQPRCALDQELDECRCECDADYELGGACPSDPADAGVDSGVDA
ncbi:MAG TPA: hypothetical protein VM261_24980 [Kofleriaceae bacterium]|nr:hypothetical protein [Kofleriaceae bacterium]